MATPYVITLSERRGWYNRRMNQAPRPIRSFVLRQGRVSRAQQAAHENLMPEYGIPFRQEMLDLEAIFGRKASRILEIGFGMGESTAQIASMNPDKDYFALEVHTPGVGSLLKRIGEMGLRNVRIVQHDAVEVLKEMVPDCSLSAVHIYFPDPWPKKRHHKRRLIQENFVSLLCSKLDEGGYLHAATDWEDYAEHILQVMNAEPLLANTAEGYAQKPSWRPLTKFEERGIRLGHPVRDILFRKIRSASPIG